MAQKFTTHPEFVSVEAFVQYLLDDERDTFLPGEAQKVAIFTGQDLQVVIGKLKDYGLKVKMNGR